MENINELSFNVSILIGKFDEVNNDFIVYLLILKIFYVIKKKYLGICYG